jgi:hypothetical protein
MDSEVQTPAIRRRDFLNLLELCADAQERCQTRCLKLIQNGQHEQAAYEAQLRDKYAYLKNRVFEAMKEEVPTQSIEQILKQLASLPVGPSVRDKSINL